MLNNSPYAMSDTRFFDIVAQSGTSRILRGGALAQRMSADFADTTHQADLTGTQRHALAAAIIPDKKGAPASFSMDDLIDGANTDRGALPEPTRAALARIVLSKPKKGLGF
jgi:hypothetical protein